MAIYRMVGGKENLVSIDKTSFGQQGVLERHDLQRILRDKPDVLEEGLFIIAEEFGEWKDSNRRIDLLGLDKSGRLVVIELKRGETGDHMDLQAIRYAAMVANLTFRQVVDIHQTYLDKRVRDDVKSIEEEDAEAHIREHLGSLDEDEPVIRTEIPRIILASEGFSKELTTCVLWLNDSWLKKEGREIKCIRFQLYMNGKETLVETSLVIPLPEAEDYITQVQEKEEETKKQRSGKSQHIQGGTAFEKSIGQAQEQFQHKLQRIYDWAVDLEHEKLVELSTFVNSKGDCIRLDLRVPSKGQQLVSVPNIVHRRVEIAVWPDKENLAPKSMRRVDELIGPVTSASGMRYRTLSKIPDLDSLLVVLRDTYSEAKDMMVSGDGSKS